MLSAPPLSLYVHLPWCVRKCPYCDFNSHQMRETPRFEDYVDQLLVDLEQDLPMVWGRRLVSIFIGGGTPSLFPPDEIGRLLQGIHTLMTVRPGTEVTLEANPGTTEHSRFADYATAGINRISLGVQSFDDGALARIGRIHGAREALEAIDGLHGAGIANFNLDLMFALPGQTLDAALRDIDLAIEAGPAHLSHYQLTIEPNTAFAHDPPELPNADDAWQMQEEAAARLEQTGFAQYEISAWSRPGSECTHNLNYWRFGDYLGIGAGAHSKITQPSLNAISRISKLRHPRAWLEAGPADLIAAREDLDPGQRMFEFFLNQLRLKQGVRTTDFEPRTGLNPDAAEPMVTSAIERGLLVADTSESGPVWRPTELGWRFVNETQQIFLEEA